MTNPVSCLFSENHFTLFSFLKNIFTGYRISEWCFLLSQHFKMFHWILACFVFKKKVIIFPWCVCLSLIVSKIFLFIISFQNFKYEMFWCSFCMCVFILLGDFFQLLFLCAYIFQQIWKMLGHFFSWNICLCPHFLSLMILMTHILDCLMWSHSSFFVYIYRPFQPLYFCLRVIQWICLQAQMFSYVLSTLLSTSTELFFFQFLSIFAYIYNRCLMYLLANFIIYIISGSVYIANL